MTESLRDAIVAALGPRGENLFEQAATQVRREKLIRATIAERRAPELERLRATFEERWGEFPSTYEESFDWMGPATLEVTRLLVAGCDSIEQFQVRIEALKLASVERHIEGARRVLREFLNRRWGHVDDLTLAALDVAGWERLNECFNLLDRNAERDEVFSALVRGL